MQSELLCSSFAVAFGILGVLASGCSSEPSEGEAHLIQLGALAPLSAPGSVVGGEAMVDAMQIAAEEINEGGGILGRTLELVIEDTAGTPETGVEVMQKMIDGGAVAIGGGYHSSVGVATKEVAVASNIPVVYAETWNDTITSDKERQVFRLAPLSSEVSELDVNFIAHARDDLGHTIEKVAIVTENTDYGIPAAETTSEGLEALGIEAQTFVVEIGETDFKSIVAEVKAAAPDYTMVLTTGEAGYAFVQQAAEAGHGPQDVPMQCNEVSLEAAYWQEAPDGNYCFVRRVGLPPELYSDEAKGFAAEYLERTGKSEVEAYAMAAYDSIKILAQAIDEAGTTEADEVIAALEAIEYKGALGTITFPYGTQKDPSEDNKEAKWWHQFPDAAITMLQYQEPDQTSVDAPVVFPETLQTGDTVWVTRE